MIIDFVGIAAAVFLPHLAPRTHCRPGLLATPTLRNRFVPNTWRRQEWKKHKSIIKHCPRGCAILNRIHLPSPSPSSSTQRRPHSRHPNTCIRVTRTKQRPSFRFG
jgi:hypothetical protein